MIRPTLVQGEDVTWRVDLLDEEGDPIPSLVSCRVVLTISASYSAISPELVKDSDNGSDEVELDEDGFALIKLLAADTAILNPRSHVFDVVLVNATGDRYFVVEPASVRVLRGVTVL